MRGFGMTMDLERGTTRNWHVGEDGVKRWSDNDQPCEPEKKQNESSHGEVVEAEREYIAQYLSGERWRFFCSGKTVDECRETVKQYGPVSVNTRIIERETISRVME